ncbi:MAG: TonB-dependent receptor [Vicinamibacterales bacterium]
MLHPASIVEQVQVTAGSASGGETALRMSAVAVDVPRSVTVLGSDRLREQQARSVSEALAYVPGMAVNSYRTGSYHFYSRGYRMGPEDTRVDGVVGLNAGGRYGGSMFGIEEVVFLRGPAGILYGSSGAPGGLVNLVSKQPTPTPMTTVDLRSSTYAGQGIAASDRVSMAVDIDSTGPLAGSRRLQYRAMATGERMRYFTSGVDDDNRYAAALLRANLGRDGLHVLTPAVTWMRFDRPHGGGLVVSPSTSLSTNDGRRGPINTADLTPLSVNHASGGGVDGVLQAGTEARGVLAGRTQYTASYRFIANDTDVDQFVPQVDVGLLQSAFVLPRVQSKSRTERRYHNVDARLDRDLVTRDAWRTRLQIGVTGRRASTRGTVALGSVPGAQSPVDIYTGTAASPLQDTYPATAFQSWTDASYWTAYTQSQTSLGGGRVVVTAGVGYGENRPAAGQPVRRSDVMPNAAVVVKPREHVSLYASYATSYTPSDPAAETVGGERGTFDPATGRNLEAGVKGDYRRVTWAAAVFHNDVSNALVQSGANDLNPNGSRYYVAAGTRRSRGAELTLEAAPLPLLQVTASLAYLDAIYTGEGPASATLAIPGSRAEKSPRWAWNAWTRYARQEGRLAGLSGALGVVHQGERLGANGPRTSAAPDPLELPAFTRVDVSLGQRVGRRAEVGVHVENVLDRLIFVNATVGSSIEVAAPRRIALRVGYRF